MSVLSYAKKGYTSELAEYCLTLSCPADGLVGKVPGDLLPWLLWFGRILAYVWKNDIGFSLLTQRKPLKQCIDSFNPKICF